MYRTCCCLALVLFTHPAACGEPSRQAWARHRAALKNHPDVVRLYLFENVTADQPEVPSAAGEKEPLRFGGEGSLTVVEGRVPGKTAVRLDRGYMAAKPFSVANRSLTVEMWVRHHGQGSVLGNGRANGMFFAQGDGYWSGLRMPLDTVSQRLQFMIGRPRPSHAIGITAAQPVSQGVWHHLAATWNGRRMRLYWNGLLAAAGAYEGEYSPPQATFKIGYANAGIGSLKLDVDEVAVFRRALDAGEILRHALDGEEVPESAVARLVRAGQAMSEGKWAAARAACEAALNQQGVSSRTKSLLRFCLGRALLRQGNAAEAARRLTVLVEDETALEAIQMAALRSFLPGGKESPRAVGSVRVYQRLLESPDLTPANRIMARLSLAECYLRVRERRPALARAELDAVLQEETLDDYCKWDIRLKRAHTYLTAKHYAEARTEYDKLARAAHVPREVRAFALLAAGHSFYREKAYGDAARAFDKAAALPDSPEYLRQEAGERAEEMKRLDRGEPARDPRASRVKLPSLPAPARVIYVAPDGKGGNPGTKSQPLATLEQARDAVHKLRDHGKLPSGGVAVFVRGGSYPVTETFELTGNDSGTPESPIVYRAVPGEQPVFTGGVTLKGFTPVTDAAVLQRLPETARAHVVQWELKHTGVTDYGRITGRGYGRCGWGNALWVDLYVDGRPMQLARWPNEGFVEMGRVFPEKTGGPSNGRLVRFGYEDDRHERWQQADDVWMFGYWSHLWAGTYKKIAAIDTKTKQIATTKSSVSDFRPGYPYYVLNLLEELDRPGEWYLDRGTGTVYLWPPAALSRATVQFPLLEKPFVSMRDVGHVTLRGLTFELGRGDGISVAGGERVLLAGCTVRRLGGNAVSIQGGRGHGVLGCDIHTIGARGVILSGGDSKTLTPGRHFVENCHIHEFTRVDRVYAPAVHILGVGNRITHNLLHDSPHHAIRLEGHEHLIELNEIHSVVYESDDQAGLDVWGSPILRGNVVRYNFWHHIGSGRQVAGQSGIRLDDMISTFLVYGNVFYRAAGGRFGAVQIHGGKDNIVDNNLFIECKAAVSFSPWGEGRWKSRLADPDLRRRYLAGGIDPTKPPFSTRYPDLAELEKNPDRNFLRRNFVVDCGRLGIRDRGVNRWLDNCRLSEDPGFADPQSRDFSLPDDSPVYDRFGFRPIPFREIGLYEDGNRASWPVKHEISPHYVREQ